MYILGDAMTEVKTAKKNKDIKGWQMLLVAFIFITIGWVMNTVIGTLILFGGFLFLLLSVARFVAEARAKKN